MGETDIHKRLQLTNEAISRLERMLRDQPNSEGLRLNMQTLKRTEAYLQERLMSAEKARDA